VLSETASAAAFHFPTIQETLTTQNLLALTTLTAMEVVLGIDNIVFIAIVAGKLPEHQREKARVIGLALALVTRISSSCRSPVIRVPRTPRGSTWSAARTSSCCWAAVS
jgi:hypothetical protein